MCEGGGGRGGGRRGRGRRAQDDNHAMHYEYGAGGKKGVGVVLTWVGNIGERDPGV